VAQNDVGHALPSIMNKLHFINFTGFWQFSQNFLTVGSGKNPFQDNFKNSRDLTRFEKNLCTQKFQIIQT